MEKLGDFLRANIPDLQTRVEETLEVKLGEIAACPLPQVVDDVLSSEYFRNLKRWQKTLLELLCKSVISGIEQFMVSRAGDSAIYYSRAHRLLWYLSDRDMTQIGLHELTHIAHATLLGISTYNKDNIPNRIKEGFAVYVAANIMVNMGMEPFYQDPTYPNRENPKDQNRRYFRQFKEELLSKNISDINGVKDYVLSFS